jgi:hypothetical protein
MIERREEASLNDCWALEVNSECDLFTAQENGVSNYPDIITVVFILDDSERKAVVPEA